MTVCTRYQRSNQELFIEEGQTIQWPKEQGQEDKQYNGQKNKDKMTYNTMAKRTRTRGQTIQWPKEQGQENKH